MARASIFHGVGPDVLAAAVDQLDWVSFPQRHNVFREGDAGDRLYIITSGRVKVACASSQSDSLIAVLGPSDVFGELALLDPGPRTSTVTTITAVGAATMTRTALRSWMSQEPEAAEQMLRLLARRLRRTPTSCAIRRSTTSPGAWPHCSSTWPTDSENPTTGHCVSTISSTRSNLPNSRAQPVSRPTRPLRRLSIGAGFVCKARRSALSIQRLWPSARDDVGMRGRDRLEAGALVIAERVLPSSWPTAPATVARPQIRRRARGTGSLPEPC